MDDSKKTPKSWANCEIMQYVRFLPDWEHKLIEFLKWQQIDTYAYIVHDEDITPDGSKGDPHLHLMLKFVNPQPTASIINAFNKAWGMNVISVQFLQKVHRWASCIAYLTHANAPGKHQYPQEKVVTNLSESDLSKTIDSVKDKVALESVLKKIETTEIREFNLYTAVSMLLYTRYKTRIDNAIQYVYNREQQLRKDRDMTVFFITGKSGIGKTTSAKFLCGKNGWSYCVSSSSNDPMQDYKGEDALILDDVRPEMWEFSDFLKLLDNHTNSSVKSRYNNKYMVYCKCIMITSTLNFYDFYKRFKNVKGEDYKQFERRLTYRVVITDDSIRVQNDLIPPVEIPNPCKLFRADEERKKQEQMQYLSKFGFKFS